MVWARLDDQMLDNPKIAKAGIYGFAMHVAGIIWCCRNLSDGHIPYARVTSLVTLDRVLIDASNPLALLDGPSSMGGDDGLDPYVVADHLVTCGMWIRTADGYEIHDFLDYNPSRAEVESKRTANAKKQAKSRDKRKNGTASPGKVTSQSPVTLLASSSLPDPDPLLSPPPVLSEISSSEPRDPTGQVTVAADPVSETRLSVHALNATADRAGGYAVTAWAEGVREGTSNPSFFPPKMGAELSKLVEALVAYCSDDAARVIWARSEGVAWASAAKAVGDKINVHGFVDWLQSGRRLRRGPQKADVQPVREGPRAWKVGQ